MEQSARFCRSALHLFRYRSLDKMSLYVAAVFTSQAIYNIHFSSCPTSAMRGPSKYIVFSHVAVHTNILSHSSTVLGRDTIPG